MAELIEIEGNENAITQVKNILIHGSHFNSVSSSTMDLRFQPFTRGSYVFNTNLSNRKMTSQDADFLKVLEDELANKEPQKDVVLFRGIREKTTLMIGDQISDRAVMSKSTVMSVSTGFACGGTLMILRFPEYSSHIYLENISCCKLQYEVISYPGELFEIKAKGKIKTNNFLLDLLYGEYSGNMYNPTIKEPKIISNFDHITSKLNTHLIVVDYFIGIQVFRGIENKCQKGAPTTPRGLEEFLKSHKIKEVLIVNSPEIEEVEYLRFGESKPFQGSILALVRDYFLDKVEKIILGEVPIMIEQYSF